MVRKIIQIDKEKCNGCGACAIACHERAIGLVDGKATLLRDDYCDGFGDCLPACPMDAIHFVEREALAYDEAAVEANKAVLAAAAQKHVCPGGKMRTLADRTDPNTGKTVAGEISSQLKQWPVQIKLVSIKAPYFDGADVLVAADCTAYAYATFHQDFMRGKVTLIGCTKLDSVDYSAKLMQIFYSNDVKSVTVARMEVPCCGGMAQAVKHAIARSGRQIPCRVVTFSIDGQILRTEEES